MPQNRTADALKNRRRIDVDGDHRPRRRLTKTDNTAGPLRYEEGAALNGIEIPRGGAIPQPRLDDLRRIVACAQCADGRSMQLMKPKGIFGACCPDHSVG